MMNVRELKFEERAKWGTCPVCGAEHGQSCDRSIGNPSVAVDDSIIGPRAGLLTGAHYGRLSRAPYSVIESVHAKEQS